MQCQLADGCNLLKPMKVGLQLGGRTFTDKKRTQCTIIVLISLIRMDLSFIKGNSLKTLCASSLQVHNVPFLKTKTHFGPGTGRTPIPLCLSLFPCLFVALLVSLNKLQRFLGNGLSKKKKVTMASFWQTASSLLLRIWGFHDIDGYL